MKKISLLLISLCFISGCGLNTIDDIMKPKEVNIPMETVDETLNNSIAQNQSDYVLNNFPEANKLISENVILLDNNINTSKYKSTIKIKNNSKYYLNGVKLALRDKNTYEIIANIEQPVSLKPNMSCVCVLSYTSLKPFEPNKYEFCIFDLNDKIYEKGKAGIDELISTIPQENIIYTGELDLVITQKPKSLINDNFIGLQIKNNTDRNLLFPNNNIMFYSATKEIDSNYVPANIELGADQEILYNHNALDMNLLIEDDLMLIFTGCNMNDLVENPID